MDSITTVTQKGQVTIPAWARKQLGEDILSMGKSVKSPKGMDVMKAIELVEKKYTRI